MLGLMPVQGANGAGLTRQAAAGDAPFKLLAEEAANRGLVGGIRLEAPAAQICQKGCKVAYIVAQRVIREVSLGFERAAKGLQERGISVMEPGLCRSVSR